MRPTYGWNEDSQGLDQLRDIFESAIYSISINYLSLPAGVVPIGHVEKLPTGVQIIGRRFREDLILDAMEVIEARVGVLAHELWTRNQNIVWSDSWALVTIDMDLLRFVIIWRNEPELRPSVWIPIQ